MRRVGPKPRTSPRNQKRLPAAPGVPTVVARQAIYDTRLQTVAYELLFRTPQPTTGNPVAGRADAATVEVLLTAFTDIGMDELVGNVRAFVNIPYQFLVDGLCETLPRERVVLEILEDVEVDDRVLSAVQRLVDQGFTIALDDFVFRAGLEPLVELADIIKVDVLALDDDEVAATAARVAKYGARLLAEKVENRRQIRPLLDLGFELFQGYALDRPAIVRGARTSANRAVMFQVVAELYRPDIEIDAIVDILSRDPSLVYALLRIVNSASLARSSRIESLQQALVMLGLDGLRNWATMIMMNRLGDGDTRSITTALVRAKMCEKVARTCGANAPGSFTVGLLSALPTILGEPLPKIVQRLSLEPAVEQALLNRQGAYGEILNWVLAYEAGDERALVALSAPPTLAAAYLESMAWARRLETAMADTPERTIATS